MQIENPKFQKFKENKNLLQIENNEIIFDMDNREIASELVKIAKTLDDPASRLAEVLIAAAKRGGYKVSKVEPFRTARGFAVDFEVTIGGSNADELRVRISPGE